MLLAYVVLHALPAMAGSVVPRYDTLPPPLRTIDLAAAAADEPVPLTAAEWKAMDAAHDRYLQGFDALRAEAIAPLVVVARAQASGWADADPAMFAPLARRHRSVMGRIRALDESFLLEFPKELPGRESLAERIGARRAVTRPGCVIEGLRDGGRDGATVMDLDPVIRALCLDAASRTAIEPARMAYRLALAAAVQLLADAELDYPSALHAALAERGLDARELARLRSAPIDGQAQQDALLDAETRCLAAERDAGRARARALVAVDDANRNGLADICAALPPAPADALRSADRRRSSEIPGTSAVVRFALQAYAAHPGVRSGTLPGTAAAARDGIAASERMREVAIRCARRRAESLALGDEPASEVMQELADANMEMYRAFGRLLAAFRTERPRDADSFQAVALHAERTTPDRRRADLAACIGSVEADRLVREMPSSMFEEDLVDEELAFDSELSLTERVLLVPSMDRDALLRAARAIGVRDDEATVDLLWEREQSKAMVMEERQRPRLRFLEQRALGFAGDLQAEPAAFERAVADYIDELRAADAERCAADEDVFREVALVDGRSEADAHRAMAREVLAARRASLPWRRFRLPWLLGPLWAADADPVSMSLLVPDAAARRAAIAALEPHAEPLRVAADNARSVGLEALGEYVRLVLRTQRRGTVVDRPEMLRDDPAIRKVALRVEEAAALRRRAQRAAIEAVGAVDPAAGDELMRQWARATMPEFFVDGHAWREACAAAATASPDAVAWRGNDVAMIRRLSEWQDTRGPAPVPDGVREFRLAAASDSRLGALATIRDETAWRLLRDRAIAEGRPPDIALQDGTRGGGAARPLMEAP